VINFPKTLSLPNFRGIEKWDNSYQFFLFLSFSFFKDTNEKFIAKRERTPPAILGSAQAAQRNHLANKTLLGAIKKSPNMLPISLANNLLPAPNFVKESQILTDAEHLEISLSSKDISLTRLYHSSIDFSK
jgi:hypothetical protein